MKVKVNLSNQTLEYMDTQPYIQGTDTRNKLSVYIEHSTIPQTEGAFNIMIAYALQNGRTTIKMANTGATAETIDDVLYDIFYFTAPKVLTSISGNFVATLILKVNSNTYKVNVLNTVLNSVEFETFESALDDVSSEFIETIEGMSSDIVELQTSVVDNLTSTAVNKPLSANMGRILAERIGATTSGLVSATYNESTGVLTLTYENDDTYEMKIGLSTTDKSNMADDVENTILADLFETFSTIKSYSTGDFVNYENNIYEFVSDKTSGAWDSTKVVVANLNDYMDEVNTSLANMTETIEGLGNLQPSGTDTSTNILAFNEDKGIYIGTDTGHWYYWNGTQYVDGGNFISSLPDTKLDINSTNAVQNKIITDILTKSKVTEIIDLSSYNEGYIQNDGTIQSNSNFGYKTFNAKKGQIVYLTAKGSGTGVMMIGYYINNVYYSLVNSNGSTVANYTYTLKEDCVVVVSFDIRYQYECRLLYSALDNDVDILTDYELYRKIDMSSPNNYYINSNGEKIENDTNYKSILINVNTGEHIYLYAKGYQTSLSMISQKTDDVYKPLVLSIDNNINTYEYIAINDMTLILSFDLRQKYMCKSLFISKENILTLVNPKNRFDKSNILMDYKLNSSGEAVAKSSSDSSRFVTDYIPFKKGDILRDIEGAHNHCFYDKDKTFVERVDYSLDEYTATYNGYVRLTINSIYLDTYILTINNKDLVYSNYYSPKYEYDKKKSNIIEVGVGKEFTSLRNALDYANNNFDNTNPCYVYIYEGIYNVMEYFSSTEIENAEYTQTGFVGLEVRDGVNLIGIGDKSNIIISGELDPNTYSLTIREAISTLNLKGNCSLENLTIKSSSLRYPIHDDFNINANSKHVLKNCDFINVIPASSTNMGYGLGTKTGQVVEFYNCYISPNFIYHNNTNFVKPSIVRMYNSCVESVLNLLDLNSAIDCWLELYNTSYASISYSQDGEHTEYLKVKNYSLALPKTPITAGNYNLKCSVDSNGKPTFSWVEID